MASIQRRERAGNTVYCVRVRRAGFPLVSKTFGSEEQAKRFADAIEADVESRGMPVAATLSDLLDRYSGHAPVSYGGECFAYWRKALGGVRLTEITPKIVRTHRDKIAATPARSHGHKSARPKRASATVRKYLVSLSAAFRYAEKELGWSLPNPVKSVQLPKPGSHRVRWLTIDERERLLAAVTASASKTLKAAVHLSLATGMRKGELYALRWQDLDLDCGTAILLNTKNGDSRCAAFSPLVTELLRALPNGKPDQRLFPNDLAKAWKTATAHAGMPDFRWHDLRHDTGTRLTAAGVSTRIVMQVLGHRQPRMALVYRHVADSTVKETMLKVLSDMPTRESPQTH